MPPQMDDDALGDAILQSVEHGSFPQSEDVASAPVPAAALPKLLETVGKAREDTKNEIRKVSRQAASDVDGWIAQARKLQDDIKRSQETAHEIVQQAEAGKQHTGRVGDAASKVSFLYSEIAYNESLVQVVEQLRDISMLVESAQDAAVHGHVLHALDRLEDVEIALKRLGSFNNTRVVRVLRSKADQLKGSIVQSVTESWNGLVIVEPRERKVTIRDEIEGEATVSITTIVDALTKLNLLDGFIIRLSRDFDKAVISPRLTRGSDQSVVAFQIEHNDICATGHVEDLTVSKTLDDLQTIAEYLNTRLPPSIAVPLSEKLVPAIASRLIANWLLPAVPLSMNGVEDFQNTLSYVLGFAEFFDELGWSGQDRLREWVDKSADIWLARRKEVALAKTRSLCSRKVQEKQTVERVETQVVSKGDAVLGGKEDEDEDWGVEWGDDGETTKETPAAPPQEVEEEDMSAWGVEDDEEPAQGNEPEPKHGDEEDADAWGWGDDEEQKPAPVPTPAPASEVKPTVHTNGKATAPPKQPAEKEVTLRETYTVTAVPDAILEIILQVVADVERLNEPDLVKSAIAPASGGLYSIPGLLLAMYRATAATHYSKDVAGDMLIYNDCTRLSDRLRAFLHDQAEKDKSSTLPTYLRATTRLKLDDAINAIETFGKRAYGREMDSQRTVIRDFLDDAQGFQTCTAPLFAGACDNAIAQTIDRIEEVKRQWQPVLSHSALLQSLGSLVSTALTKFITDIEDLSDIAEDESKKLHGYCVSLSSLSSLFQSDDDSGEGRDMTSIYTPNWFKFQYLGEILDSSLADIKYFWTDGELKLEMEAEEVIDLIKALFAESDYRRKAIADIRRTSKQ